MDPWYRLVVPAMVDSGLRIGELAALDVRHFVVLVSEIGGRQVLMPADEAYGQTILGGTFDVQRSTAFATKELSGAETYQIVGGEEDPERQARGRNDHSPHRRPPRRDDS